MHWALVPFIVLTIQSRPDYWPFTEDHVHQVTPGHRQHKTASYSSIGGDRSPVAALEGRVRELQAVLVLLGKDLRDLEQTGCSCQDQAFQPASQGQAKSCSWCRTKSKLGIIRREISTRAKKAFGIPRKQDRTPAPGLATATPDLPPPHNTTSSPEPPAPTHNPWPIEELPASSGMFEPPAPADNLWFMEEMPAPRGMSELDNAGAWPPGRSELAVGFGSRLQKQMGNATFTPYGTPVTRASGSIYTPGSSFSDGFTGGPLRATPSRPFNQGSMVSTSSSSFQGSHSWVTPQSSRSNTSNSLPLINTDFRTVTSHNKIFESPTTLEPSLGTNSQHDVPPWSRKNADLWGSTSTLADDIGNGVNNPFGDIQWKGPTDHMYTADASTSFDYSSTRGNGIRVDIEPHGPPPFASFGTPQYTRHSSWDDQISELPCPSTLAFAAAPIEAGVHRPGQSTGATAEAHGIRQPRLTPRKPLRSATRSNFEHLGDGVGAMARFMCSPLNYSAAFARQPLTQRNDAALTPHHFHTYPPIGPSLHSQPYAFGEPPQYPFRIPITPHRPQVQHTGMPQPLHPLPAAAAAASPQLPDQRDPAGSNRQSSLVGLGCKRCRRTFTGKDPRKALKRHKETNAHRRRAGQAVGSRILCPAPSADGVNLCGRKFLSSRRDNLVQHMRLVHGGLKLEDCGPVRYELEDEFEVDDEDDVDMSDG